MELTALSFPLLLKAFLRVAPLGFFLKLPTNLQFPILFRLLPVVTFSIILAIRFQNDGQAPEPQYFFDLAFGIAIALVCSLFFSASMQVTKFFHFNGDADEGEGFEPWRDVLESFTFVVLLILIMSLHLERSFLELLGTVNSNSKLVAKFGSSDLWTHLLREITWLGLKISSFSFVLVFTKALFEEIYRRLGGETLQVIFSLSFWLILLVMSPLFAPLLGAFVSEQLSTFWRTWMAV